MRSGTDAAIGTEEAIGHRSNVTPYYWQAIRSLRAPVRPYGFSVPVLTLSDRVGRFDIPTGNLKQARLCYARFCRKGLREC